VSMMPLPFSICLLIRPQYGLSTVRFGKDSCKIAGLKARFANNSLWTGPELVENAEIPWAVSPSLSAAVPHGRTLNTLQVWVRPLNLSSNEAYLCV
jgi:hypothetical protein